MNSHIKLTITAFAALITWHSEVNAQVNPPVIVDTFDNEINVNPANPKNYSQDTVVGVPKTNEPGLAPKPIDINTPSPDPTGIPSAPPSSVPASPNTVPSTTPSGSPNKVGTPKR